MNKRERDFLADRALRNAARALVERDIRNVREDLSTRGIKDRVTDRMTDGAMELFEEATEMADSNRGILATLIGAVFIWFARHPILSFLGLEDEQDDDDEPWLFEDDRDAHDWRNAFD